MKAPAFQFYPKDFLEGSACMSNAEAGAYIKLLCHQWLQGHLVDDKTILTRLCNGDNDGLEEALKKFKSDKKGKLKNIRLENERKKQKNYQKNLSERGKKGAKNRWCNDKSANKLDTSAINHAINYAMPKNGSASASASSTAVNSLAAIRAEVLEIMRRSTDRTYSDDLLKRETAAFISKYGADKIGNIASLVGGWMVNVKPDIPEKKMVY